MSDQPQSPVSWEWGAVGCIVGDSCAACAMCASWGWKGGGGSASLGWCWDKAVSECCSRFNGGAPCVCVCMALGLACPSTADQPRAQQQGEGVLCKNGRSAPSLPRSPTRCALRHAAPQAPVPWPMRASARIAGSVTTTRRARRLTPAPHGGAGVQQVGWWL